MWRIAETNTHQDHVIAHVVGATALGHFTWDETAYLLLDIGFIWNIYLDGEMGLLPHPVMVTELEADDFMKIELRSDIDTLLREEFDSLLRMKALSPRSPIQSIDFFAAESARKLVLTCAHGSLVVETSLETRDVKIISA